MFVLDFFTKGPTIGEPNLHRTVPPGKNCSIWLIGLNLTLRMLVLDFSTNYCRQLLRVCKSFRLLKLNNYKIMLHSNMALNSFPWYYEVQFLCYSLHCLTFQWTITQSFCLKCSHDTVHATTCQYWIQCRAKKARWAAVLIANHDDWGRSKFRKCR
jgi:hypothetical protein